MKEITWHGHSNVTIQADGKKILIDPFFTGNPECDLKAGDVDELDLVLVTHDHGDHVGDTVEIMEKTDATMVTIFDTAQHLLAQNGLDGDRVVGMNFGGTWEYEGVRIKMVQSAHSATTGSPGGFIITFSDGFCVYHAGDTAITMDMKLFGKFHDIDLALLPIDGFFNMDGRQAAYACKLLSCKKVIPIHWGTFPILAQSPERLEKYLPEYAPETELVVIKPGETIQL